MKENSTGLPSFKRAAIRWNAAGWVLESAPEMIGKEPIRAVRPLPRLKAHWVKQGGTT